jgi:hypothetical protein
MELENTFNILVGKSRRKGPLGRPRRRWKDKIKNDIGKRECVWTKSFMIDLNCDNVSGSIKWSNFSIT